MRGAAFFLDDQEALGVVDDVFDAGILVPGQHDEVSRHGTDWLVLGSCRADLLDTNRLRLTGFESRRIGLVCRSSP